MLPSQEDIQRHLDSLHDYVAQIPLPDIPAMVERVVDDIRRFGPLPSLPQLGSVPGLGAFQLPAAPPPPPPPPPQPPAVPWFKTKGFIAFAAIGTATLGLGLASRSFKKKRRHRVDSREKPLPLREVIVVLGADTVAGPALVHALEKAGYVVIASVSSPEHVELLERRSKGFVKALVLDPREPQSMRDFLRSMHATFSLKFPMNVAGDPYLPSSTSTQTNALISVISLLSLTHAPPPTPIERLDLPQVYMPVLYESHLAPLAVIQSLLPLFRISANRQGRQNRTSIIVAVPAVASRVGVAFDGAKAMAVAGLVKGVEILRREVGKETKVVLLDVGSLEDKSPEAVINVEPPKQELDVVALTRTWTPGERRLYGSSYEAAVGRAIEGPKKKRRPSRRAPQDVEVLVRSVLGIVNSSRPWSIRRPKNLLANLWIWVLGYRLGVGAGAFTYTFASFLPSFVLEALLQLPASMVSLRNRLATPKPHYSPKLVPKKPLEEPKTIEGVSSGDISSMATSEVAPSSPGSLSSLEGPSHVEDAPTHLTESLVSDAPSTGERSEHITESWVSLNRSKTLSETA